MAGTFWTTDDSCKSKRVSMTTKTESKWRFVPLPGQSIDHPSQALPWQKCLDQAAAWWPSAKPWRQKMRWFQSTRWSDRVLERHTPHGSRWCSLCSNVRSCSMCSWSVTMRAGWLLRVSTTVHLPTLQAATAVKKCASEQRQLMSSDEQVVIGKAASKHGT